MTKLALRAQPAVEELASLNENQLYGELGARLQAIARAPDRSDQFDMIPGQPLESYGAPDDIKNLGKRFFERWRRQTYDLIRGSAEDGTASAVSRNALAATAAGALVTVMGLTPALAAVVAALAVKILASRSQD